MYPTSKHAYHDFISSPYFGRMSFQNYLRMAETSRALIELIGLPQQTAEVIPFPANNESH